MSIKLNPIQTKTVFNFLNNFLQYSKEPQFSVDANNVLFKLQWLLKVYEKDAKKYEGIEIDTNIERIKPPNTYAMEHVPFLELVCTELPDKEKEIEEMLQKQLKK